MPTNRSGNCKHNPGAQISKATLKPYGSYAPQGMVHPPWMLETLILRPCYPRYPGINRRSCLESRLVLDMEYREQELPEHGPGGPFFFFSARFVLPAVPASITTGLGLHQRRLLLHEVIGPRYHGMCHI
jgi:hypothetical protein